MGAACLGVFKLAGLNVVKPLSTILFSGVFSITLAIKQAAWQHCKQFVHSLLIEQHKLH